MAQRRKRRVRQKGKISLRRYFQNLETGQEVAIKPELALQPSIPRRFKGKVGTIEGKQGQAYIIKFKDGNKEKRLIVKPIHLVRV